MLTAPTYRPVSKLYKSRTPTSSENSRLFAVSFAVNGEFYFTSLLLGFLRRLVAARKPIFRLTARNELRAGVTSASRMHEGF